MPIFSSRPALRWLVPVAVVVAVVGGGAAARTIAASAEPELPARSAAQLLVDLQTARLDGLSGTVRTTADLGLPDLPAIGGHGSAELTALISGSRTLRVWYAGPDKARVALLGTLGESDVIRNGTDLWLWDSRTRKATHEKLAEAAGRRPDASALGLTPQQAADLALRSIDPTTVVSTGSNARVAGRPAYELILAPRDTDSLIGQVRIAIDAREHVPLRAQVFAKGSAEPAYEVAFTSVSFTRPDDSQFRFNPPPGTTVEEIPAGEPGDAHKAVPPIAGKPGVPGKPGAPDTPGGPEADRPRVVGTGWTSVLITKTQAQRPDLLTRLPAVSGDWGSGQLLTGRLFSVLFTDDGRVLAGAVSPQRLYEAARG